MLKWVKKNALVIVKLLVSIILFLSLILPWWMSVDARYARDNLGYLEERMEEAGLLTRLPGWKLTFMSQPQLLARICELSDTWADGYVNAITSANEISGEYHMDSRFNPYDTFARLILGGHATEVQEIYLTVQYDAAILNPDSELNDMFLEQWKHDSEMIRNKTNSLLADMAKQMRAQVIGATMLILLIWLFKPISATIKSITKV